MACYRAVVATPVTPAPSIYPVIMDDYPEFWYMSDVTHEWTAELAAAGRTGQWACQMCGDDESNAPDAFERLAQDPKYHIIDPVEVRDECND